jgi:protein-tyrosine-phosphatase
MDAPVYDVLFLCTGNSARSILAESLLDNLGKGRFRAFSAGSHPSGRINPFALELLQKSQLPVAGLRSKAWDEFAQPGAPQFDFIFTVCDKAAGEVCPVWPGHPITAHWGVPDPVAVEGSDDAKHHAMVDAMNALQRRICMFVSLPFAKLDRMKLQQAVNDIGGAR